MSELYRMQPMDYWPHMTEGLGLDSKLLDDVCDGYSFQVALSNMMLARSDPAAASRIQGLYGARMLNYNNIVGDMYKGPLKEYGLRIFPREDVLPEKLEEALQGILHKDVIMAASGWPLLPAVMQTHEGKWITVVKSSIDVGNRHMVPVMVGLEGKNPVTCHQNYISLIISNSREN